MILTRDSCRLGNFADLLDNPESRGLVLVDGLRTKPSAGIQCVLARMMDPSHLTHACFGNFDCLEDEVYSEGSVTVVTDNTCQKSFDWRILEKKHLKRFF